MKKLFRKILTFILALITGFSAPVSITEKAVVSQAETDINIFTYTVSDSQVIIEDIAPLSPAADVIVPEYINGIPVKGIEASALCNVDNYYDYNYGSNREDIKSLTLPYNCDILNIGVCYDYYFWVLPHIKCEKQSAAHKTLYKHSKQFEFEIINDDGTEDFLWLDWKIKDGKAHITGRRKITPRSDFHYYSNPDYIVFPSVLEGCPVVSVEGFFKDSDENYGETNILFSDSIETVKTKAFFDYFIIGTVNFGNNVKTIEAEAFFETLVSNVIAGKNVKEIAPTAFYYEINTTFYCYKNSAMHKYVDKVNESRDADGYMKWPIVFIDESHLTSEVADIDESGNIKGLPTGLTNETVKDYLAVDGDAMMEVSDEVVGTGTTVKLINSEYGTIDNTYTVILDGDINGDGNVNTAEDTSAMRKIISGDDSAFSEADKLAADINGDGLVNSTDLILMKTSQN